MHLTKFFKLNKQSFVVYNLRRILCIIKIGYISVLVINQIFVLTKINGGEAGGGIILKTVI